MQSWRFFPLFVSLVILNHWCHCRSRRRGCGWLETAVSDAPLLHFGPVRPHASINGNYSLAFFLLLFCSLNPSFSCVSQCFQQMMIACLQLGRYRSTYCVISPRGWGGGWTTFSPPDCLYPVTSDSLINSQQPVGWMNPGETNNSHPFTLDVRWRALVSETR